MITIPKKTKQNGTRNNVQYNKLKKKKKEENPTSYDKKKSLQKTLPQDLGPCISYLLKTEEHEKRLKFYKNRNRF